MRGIDGSCIIVITQLPFVESLVCANCFTSVVSFNHYYPLMNLVID